jgi:hypothetical protein
VDERPDLRTIDFTITEELGRFVTTPEVARRMNIAGEYVCLDCLNTITDRRWMCTDLSVPNDGWHHFQNCPGK